MLLHLSFVDGAAIAKFGAHTPSNNKNYPVRLIGEAGQFGVTRGKKCASLGYVIAIDWRVVLGIAPLNLSRRECWRFGLNFCRCLTLAHGIFNLFAHVCSIRLWI